MPSLLEVPLRQTVVVERVDGERSFRRRIMEMGLVPGTPVRVVGGGPAGRSADARAAREPAVHPQARGGAGARPRS